MLMKNSGKAWMDANPAAVISPNYVEKGITHHTNINTNL